MAADEYLLAGQTSELERLQLQSRVWEPSGQRLLEAIGPGRDRALDVGCGVLGWLRLLSRWVSPDGWHFNPPAPALEQLITFICEAFHRWGDAAAGPGTAGP